MAMHTITTMSRIRPPSTNSRCLASPARPSLWMTSFLPPVKSSPAVREPA